MDKVCYILGAGFSAPLGLPVMRNFLLKSKDLYFSNPKKYKGFKTVFDLINSLSVAKNYYDTDLFNIEEILSIIEMQSFLKEEKLKPLFIEYIHDVIDHFTPEMEPYGQNFPSNWETILFGNKTTLRSYGKFISSIFNLVLYEETFKAERLLRQLHAKRHQSPETQYSIITLNYDLVLENIVNFINTEYHPNTHLSFADIESDGNEFDWTIPYLTKLHGSIDSGSIVPPTWNKGIHQGIVKAWNVAYNLLTQANYLRFIGYSLPTADAYVKYLLKSAILEAPHLKGIDVLCSDSTGETKKRYSEFIKFGNYRFVSGDVVNYLGVIDFTIQSSATSDPPLPSTTYKAAKFDLLEEAHERFFS